MKVRADVLVQQRGLAESRAKAQALILAGNVIAGDHRVEKPGQLLDSSLELRVKEQLRYVSRGGLKLERALDEFGLSAAGRVCVDLGASTGGFTDVLLQRGALRVHAVDVGYGQLHPRDAWACVLVKPQFEAGRAEVGKGGVVRDPFVHARVVDEISEQFRKSGFNVHGSVESPVRGPAGNREYLVAASRS